MTRLRKAWAACTLAGAALGASAQVPVPPFETFYFVGAAGRTQYDYDCWFWYDCYNARGTMGKLGAGWRLGPIFALEAWYMDFGRADIEPAPDELRMKAGVFNAAWYLPFSPQLQGLLRAGVADVRHERSRDQKTSTFSGYFGLGLVLAVAPAVALEFGWDITGADGHFSGTTTASAFSLGLRVRF